MSELFTIEPNPKYTGEKGQKKSIVRCEKRDCIKIFYDMNLRQFPFDVQR